MTGNQQSQISSFRDLDTSAIETDVCIIGSGPSAQATAARASAKGRRVLCLEAGNSCHSRRLTHSIAADVPATGSNAPDPGDQVSLRLGGSIERAKMRLDQTSPDVNGIRMALLHQGDFAERPVGAPGWPIEQSDLMPYYLEAGADVGISSAVIRRAMSSSGAMAPDDDASEAGIPDREASSELGAMHPFWCVDKRHIEEPAIERFGGADVLTNAPVWRLRIDTEGRVTAAVVRAADGRTLEVLATDFVVAAGLFASTRILLESRWSGGSEAANSSGLLGVGLMDHPILSLGTVTPDMMGPALIRGLAPVLDHEVMYWPKLTTAPSDDDVGIQLTVLPSTGIRYGREPRTRRGGRRSAQTLADQFRTRVFDIRTPVHLAKLVAATPELLELTASRRTPEWSFEDAWWGSVPAEDLPSRFDILALPEQLPRSENRIVLSDIQTVNGSHRLRIHWDWSDEDRRLATRAAEPILHRLASTVGPVTPNPIHRHVRQYSAHHGAGTMRMSATADTGVVDSQCRTHDHPNLFVVGSAVFPSQGFANPTLTDIALGLRLGELLA